MKYAVIGKRNRSYLEQLVENGVVEYDHSCGQFYDPLSNEFVRESVAFYFDASQSMTNAGGVSFDYDLAFAVDDGKWYDVWQRHQANVCERFGFNSLEIQVTP